jgi:uncharacterized membrane protein YesL
MALFYNSINKAGPGIKKSEPKKKAFFLFWDIYFRKFPRLMQLSLLYLLSCIPIVTFGPATAALTSLLRNYAREENAFVWMDYRDAFLKYWKKGLLASLFDALLVLSLISFNLYLWLFTAKGQPLYLYACSGIILGCAIIYLFMRPYLYTMIVTFNLKFSVMLKNALLFAFIGLIRNFISTATGLLMIWGSIKLVLYAYLNIVPMEITIPLMLILVPVTINFLSVFVSYPLIKKHMIDPVSKPDQKGEDESIFKD